MPPKPPSDTFTRQRRARQTSTGATLEPLLDSISALAVVTATDDAGAVQLFPNNTLQDGSRLSDIPMDPLLALLLEACDNAVLGDKPNEELGPIAELLAASEAGGDAVFEGPRTPSPITVRAFEFMVVSTTLSGMPDLPDLGMPERVLLTTKNSSARPTIVLGFRSPGRRRRRRLRWRPAVL